MPRSRLEYSLAGKIAVLAQHDVDNEIMERVLELSDDTEGVELVRRFLTVSENDPPCKTTFASKDVLMVIYITLYEKAAVWKSETPEDPTEFLGSILGQIKASIDNATNLQTERERYVFVLAITKLYRELTAWLFECILHDIELAKIQMATQGQLIEVFAESPDLMPIDPSKIADA